MSFIAARVGDAISEIDTPALIVDLAAFERNLVKMANLATTAGVRLRPHAKTHRCATIAHKQIQYGAVGQCCQKVSEAEVLVHNGVRDVLVTNQIIDPRKLRRLAALAKSARVALCFDAFEPVTEASLAASEYGVVLDAFVEIDVGMGRCGVPPSDALALAMAIDQSAGLRFAGLQAYHGSAQHMKNHDERKAAIESAARAVRSSKESIEQAGLICETVGGGGTGTFRFEAASGLWNELQCGSYLFMDGEYASILDHDRQPYSEFEQSLFVLTSVTSTAVPGRAIVDAGLKSYTLEKGLPAVHLRNDIRFIGASDEHGTLALNAGSRAALGARLRLVPSHCDPTINLHDHFVCVRDDRVEAIWPISARGASS